MNLLSLSYLRLLRKESDAGQWVLDLTLDAQCSHPSTPIHCLWGQELLTR